MLTKSFLPSVGLWHSSNTFAECVWSFDECPCDSAKKSCPVLMVSLIRCNVCKVLLGTSCKYTFFSSHGYLIELSDQRLHHLPIQRPTLFFYYGGVLFLNQPTTDKYHGYACTYKVTVYGAWYELDSEQITGLIGRTLTLSKQTDVLYTKGAHKSKISFVLIPSPTTYPAIKKISASVPPPICLSNPRPPRAAIDDVDVSSSLATHFVAGRTVTAAFGSDVLVQIYPCANHG